MVGSEEYSHWIWWIHRIVLSKPLYWLLRASVRERAPWAFSVCLFLAVSWDSALERAGAWFTWTRENRSPWQQTLKKGLHKPHERAAKDLLRHDATIWITSFTSCPLAHVVLLQAAQR